MPAVKPAMKSTENLAQTYGLILEPRMFHVKHYMQMRRWKWMSKYTTQVRWIIESKTTDMEGQPISARITAAAPKIFDFNYPIWAEDTVSHLKRKYSCIILIRR